MNASPDRHHISYGVAFLGCRRPRIRNKLILLQCSKFIYSTIEATGFRFEVKSYGTFGKFSNLSAWLIEWKIVSSLVWILNTDNFLLFFLERERERERERQFMIIGKCSSPHCCTDFGFTSSVRFSLGLLVFLVTVPSAVEILYWGFNKFI